MAQIITNIEFNESEGMEFLISHYQDQVDFLFKDFSEEFNAQDGKITIHYTRAGGFIYSISGITDDLKSRMLEKLKSTNGMVILITFINGISKQ